MAGWIWKKSRNVFKPRLTLEHTGYSGQGFRQWCLQFANKRGGIATCGLSAMDDAPVEWLHDLTYGLLSPTSGERAMIDPHALRTLARIEAEMRMRLSWPDDVDPDAVKEWADSSAALLSALPETPRQILGTWPEHCEQRAFVEGAMWQLMKDERATPYPRERHDAEEAAIERYGLPAPPPPSEEQP